MIRPETGSGKMFDAGHQWWRISPTVISPTNDYQFGFGIAFLNGEHDEGRRKNREGHRHEGDGEQASCSPAENKD